MYGPEITLLSRSSKMGARWCFKFMSAKEKHTKSRKGRVMLDKNDGLWKWSGAPWCSSAVAAVRLRRFRVNPDRIGVIHISERSVNQNITNLLKRSYSGSSASCCNAFLATVWKACSTLIASFAEVSKYGILPFDWHQVIARFCVTCPEK